MLPTPGLWYVNGAKNKRTVQTAAVSFREYTCVWHLRLLHPFSWTNFFNYYSLSFITFLSVQEFAFHSSWSFTQGDILCQRQSKNRSKAENWPWTFFKLIKVSITHERVFQVVFMLIAERRDQLEA